MDALAKVFPPNRPVRPASSGRSSRRIRVRVRSMLPSSWSPAHCSVAQRVMLAGSSPDAGSYPFTVTVTDAGGLTGPQAFQLDQYGFVTTQLPSGGLNRAYSHAISVAGSSNSDYRWNVVGGSLPPGLTLNPDGVIVGTPTAPGLHAFTVTATGVRSCSVAPMRLRMTPSVSRNRQGPCSPGRRK